MDGQAGLIRIADLHVFLDDFICKLLVAAQANLLKLLAVHLGDLEQDVGLFRD